MAKLSGKLTAKAMGWDRINIGAATKNVPAEGGRVLLGRVVGIVNDLKQTVNNDTGEIQNGLKGQFRGISTRGAVPKIDDKGKLVKGETMPGIVGVGEDGAPKGDTITAGVCYLPGGIQDMIEGALAVAKESDARATVQFGIDLYAIPSTNKAGYSFDADNLVTAEESDPLDALLLAAASADPVPLLTDDSDDGGEEGDKTE